MAILLITAACASGPGNVKSSILDGAWDCIENGRTLKFDRTVHTYSNTSTGEIISSGKFFLDNEDDPTQITFNGEILHIISLAGDILTLGHSNHTWGYRTGDYVRRN